MDVNKKIEDIINKFKEKRTQLSRNEELELEVRVPITKDAYDNILDIPELAGKWRLELAINVMSANIYERKTMDRTEKQYRRQIIFDGVIKKSDKFYEKIRMQYPVHVNDYLPYSIHLNKEVLVPEFISQSSAIVRMRVRMSTILNFGDLKWILDVSAIKQVEFSAIKDIKQLRDQLFGDIKLSRKGVLSGVRHDLMTAYEVELELDKNSATSNLCVNSFGVIKWLWSKINPNYSAETLYQAEIYNIASYIYDASAAKNFMNSEYRLKRLGNQVKVLTKADYYKDIYPPIGYFATIKADGIRAFVSLRNSVLRVVSDKLYEYGKHSLVDEKFGAARVYIADAEMVAVRAPDNSIVSMTLYIFDVIVYEDNNLTELDFSERIKYISKITAAFNQHVKNKYPVAFVGKQYIELTELDMEKQIRAIYEDKYPHETDGLIMTAPRGGYRETNNYKWKPSHMNTIDFLAIRPPVEDLAELGIIAAPGYIYYFLFVGIDINMFKALAITQLSNYSVYFPKFQSQKYFPVHFASAANPRAFIYAVAESAGLPNLNNQIVELRWNSGWEFMRIREDRAGEQNYYGNDYRIAELTYMNYIDEFKIEDLFHTGVYFNKSTDIAYLSGNRLRRQLFEITLGAHISKPKIVVDMACGRGADIFRYAELGAEQILAIDNDAAAIATLIRRKLDSIMRSGNTRGDVRGDVRGDTRGNTRGDTREIVRDKVAAPVKINTIVADLNQKYTDTIALYKKFGIEFSGAQLLVCNFAIHYMCATTGAIENIIAFARENLATGGIWSITCFNGREIFTKLKKYKKGERWEMSDMGRVKYSIGKLYSSDQFAEAGQKISVLMPFSNEEYEEYLVNFDFFTKAANAAGFRLLDNKSFGELAKNNHDKFKNLIDGMTADDLEYNSLYSMLIYIKE